MWKEDCAKNTLISYVVFGSYYAFVNNDKFSPAETIRSITHINENLKNLI